jgi:3-deoxy-D-manno-octulosonate 8-phosphate phosphatase (KDO 8-P phosphatase)
MLGKIRAVILDVDGVLTDGTFWWGTKNEELKRFSFADTTGIALAQKAGLVLALASAESSPAGVAIVKRFARKLMIKDVYSACGEKSVVVREVARRHGLDLSEVCFVGDDVNDLPAMGIVGVSAAPANAHPSVLAKARLRLRHRGGRGAVRELLDSWMESRSRSGRKRRGKEP